MEKKVIIDNCEFIYNYLYPFDSETFYKFIEDKTKVQRDFFWFDEINDHMILKWKYSNFKKLLDDVRFLNLPYVGINKRNYFENKKYFIHLEKEYKKNYYEDNFSLDINYNTICAWKK